MKRIIIIIVLMAILAAALPTPAHAWGDGYATVFYSCKGVRKVNTFPVFRTSIARWGLPWGCTITNIIVPKGFNYSKVYQDSQFQILITGL